MQTQLKRMLLVVLCALPFVGLTGCRKKAKPAEICIKTHAHVLSLLQAKLNTLPKGKTATPKQLKDGKRLAKLHKNLSTKRGRERSIIKCSKSNKHKIKVTENGKTVVKTVSPSPKHQCALKAKSLEDVKKCYMPSKKKKMPTSRKTS